LDGTSTAQEAIFFILRVSASAAGPEIWAEPTQGHTKQELALIVDLRRYDGLIETCLWRSIRRNMNTVNHSIVPTEAPPRDSTADAVFRLCWICGLCRQAAYVRWKSA